MSVVLRRTMHHGTPGSRGASQHAEVLMVNPGKVTAALLAAAVDADAARGEARSTPWTFVLDNGMRFEAHEVKVGDAWEPIDAARASAIVDGAPRTLDGPKVQRARQLPRREG